eukprot:scaffold826_cov335-Pavlova_lutheri.AAC.19
MWCRNLIARIVGRSLDDPLERGPNLNLCLPLAIGFNRTSVQGGLLMTDGPHTTRPISTRIEPTAPTIARYTKRL